MTFAWSPLAYPIDDDLCPWPGRGHAAGQLTNVGSVDAGRAARHTCPDASSGELCAEVDELSDEAEGCVALRIDSEDEATRELEDAQRTGLGMVRPSQVPVPTRVKLPSGLSVM